MGLRVLNNFGILSPPSARHGASRAAMWLITKTGVGIYNMSPNKLTAKDPICGMHVDKATALHAERDGQTSYFCSDYCRREFLSTPTRVVPEHQATPAFGM